MRTNGSYLKSPHSWRQTPAFIVFSVDELELFDRDDEPDQVLRKLSPSKPRNAPPPRWVKLLGGKPIAASRAWFTDFLNAALDACAMSAYRQVATKMMRHREFKRAKWALSRTQIFVNGL